MNISECYEPLYLTCDEFARMGEDSVRVGLEVEPASRWEPARVSFEREMIEGEFRAVMHFEAPDGKRWRYVLREEDAKLCSAAFLSDDTAAWKGRYVELYVDHSGVEPVLRLSPCLPHTSDSGTHSSVRCDDRGAVESLLDRERVFSKLRALRSLGPDDLLKHPKVGASPDFTVTARIKYALPGSQLILEDFEFPVSLRTMDQDKLVKAFGKDTESWIGRHVYLSLEWVDKYGGLTIPEVGDVRPVIRVDPRRCPVSEETDAAGSGVRVVT